MQYGINKHNQKPLVNSSPRIREMNESNYTPPKFKEPSFNCPHCGAFAQQDWDELCSQASLGKETNLHFPLIDLDTPSGVAPFSFLRSLCKACGKNSIWRGRYVKDTKMIYPFVLSAPPPNLDMPEEVQRVYEEARSVSHLSARAAAALLRVALEKLTAHLGETEGNLNTRIKKLKERGLPQQVIKGLDTVRIYANDGGSHAGQIDLGDKDNAGVVTKLFKLVNFIVEKTISDEKEINEMFDSLPENKKAGIKNRDSS